MSKKQLIIEQASYGIFYDLWMRSEDQPTKDTQQDGKNIIYSSTNSSLMVEFTRALNTNDPQDYVIVTNDSMPLIWAINPTSKIRMYCFCKME